MNGAVVKEVSRNIGHVPRVVIGPTEGPPNTSVLEDNAAKPSTPAPARESRSGMPCHSLCTIPEKECGRTPKTWCSATKPDRKGHTVQDATTGSAPNEDQNLGPREKQHALGSFTELRQEEAEEHSGASRGANSLSLP